MPTPDLGTLLKPRSGAEWLADLFLKLQARAAANPAAIGSIDDWTSGGIYRTLLEIDADALAQLDTLIPAITRGGFLETASGLWLDLVAFNQYGLLRERAVFTVGRAVLADTGGLGPQVFQPTTMWVQNGSARRFLVLEGGTVALNGSLPVTVKAEQPGEAWNLALNTLTRFVTPIPGLTINNPAIAGSNPPTWLLTAGADTESDERLRNRCRLRWAARLAPAGPRAAFEGWAREASASVTRVRVDDNQPRGQGTVNVWVYGNGGLGLSVLATVNDYIQARRPITSDVLVQSALVTTVTLTITYRVRAGMRAVAEPAALESLAALERALGIGEIVYRAAIVDAVLDRILGGLDVTTDLPSDVVLGTNNVAAFNTTWVWQEI